MILHNDIWGDTSVTLIEEIDNQFLIVRELNMLALYSRLNKEQSHALQQALATFYEILFSSKDKDKIDDTVPFTPDISFDDDGNGYLLAMLAYHLYCFRSASESIRERMSQNGWTKEKVQAEIEKQKQFTAESIERNLLSYEPSWLEECYKAVDIKSFAAQFWGRYNFARENTAMRNEYDFSSAKRNPYTT